ncbi:MAG: hypothetical protein Alpg2KO_14740 [Alphaproteobacteria bacterium]
MGVEKTQDYVVKGNWLVARQVMPGLLGYHFRPLHQRIPGMARTSTLGLYRNWLIGGADTKQSWQIAAPMMNNRRKTGRGRALYPDRRQSLKVAPLSSDYAARMAREIAGREQIAEIGALPAPALQDHGTQAGPDLIWLTEDMVAGRRLGVIRDRRLIAGSILPAFARQAAETQQQAQPIAELLPAASADEPVLLTRLRDQNPLASQSLCHGDVTAANCCVTPNGWTMLDWEWVGQGHALADILHLAFKHHAKLGWMLAAIARHAEEVDPAGRQGYIQGVALLAARMLTTPCLTHARRAHIDSFITHALAVLPEDDRKHLTP